MGRSIPRGPASPASDLLRPGSCKKALHMSWRKEQRRAERRLSSRQPERGAAAGGARSDCGKRPAAVFTFGRWPRANGGRSARQRRTGISAIATSLLSSIGAARFRAARGGADQRLGRWPAGIPSRRSSGSARPYLAFARDEPAFLSSAMFEIRASPSTLIQPCWAASERAFRASSGPPPSASRRWRPPGTAPADRRR